MAKIKMLKPLVPRGDGRTVIPPTRVSQGTSDPVYNDERYKVWRKAVVANAGARCEAIDNGFRCTKRAPESRLFADHIVELRDGGLPFDPANGQCLCGRHHSLKTAKARAERAGIDNRFRIGTGSDGQQIDPKNRDVGATEYETDRGSGGPSISGA